MCKFKKFQNSDIRKVYESILRIHSLLCASIIQLETQNRALRTPDSWHDLLTANLKHQTDLRGWIPSIRSNIHQDGAQNQSLLHMKKIK
jgi:hypothetical protein